MTLLPGCALAALLVGAPQDLEALRMRGAELMLAGKAAEAVALWEGALRAHGPSAEIDLRLGEAYMELAGPTPPSGDAPAARIRLRHLEQAATHLETALKAGSDVGDLAGHRLLLLYDATYLDRPARLEATARTIIRRRPDSMMAYLSLAETLVAQKRADEAGRVLSAAIGRVPADARFIFASIVVSQLIEWEGLSRAVVTQVVSAALREADAEIARKSDRLRDAWKMKAAAYLLVAERGATSEVEKANARRDGDAAFEMFRSLAPPDPAADVARAEADAREARTATIAASLSPLDAHLDAGRQAEARQVLEAASAAHGNDVVYWEQLAMLYMRRTEFPKAIDALARAAALEPDNADRHHVIATYRWDIAYRQTTLSPAERRTHVTEGLAAADRALALRPDHMEAMVYRGLLLRVQADLETNATRKAALLAEAERAAERALAIHAAKVKGDP